MKIINKNTITCEEEKINTLFRKVYPRGHGPPLYRQIALCLPVGTQTLPSLRSHVRSKQSKMQGELFYLLRRSKKFPEEVAKFYASEILLAIEYLHARNIIYRDLKPENILLDQHGHIKITDFGLSKVCNSDKQITYSICGTPEYVAPEVMIGKGYSQTADWFSFVTFKLCRVRCCTICSLENRLFTPQIKTIFSRKSQQNQSQSPRIFPLKPSLCFADYLR